MRKSQLQVHNNDTLARYQPAGSLHRRDWLLGTVLSAAAALGRGGGWAAHAADVRDGDRAESGWWTWRGPLGSNIAASADFTPRSLSSEKLLWQSPVPGRGHSSPIVTGREIFLTTADTAENTQSVLAYSRDDGKLLWSDVVHRGGLPKENHRKNSEATPTVAFDGTRLLTTFYNSDAIWVTAYSRSGDRLWQQSIGRYAPQQYKYGYAASPALYRGTAIVVGDFDGPSFLTSISLEDGKPVWKTARHGRMSFSSPIVATVSGRDQLLLSGGEKVASYDPATGKLLWSAPATTMATAGTVVWDEDHVYASGGYPKAETACVRADGSGEVVWKNNQQCYEQSMLTVGGYVYAVTDQGIAYCWRCSDGEVMWRERLGGNFSSSPLLVGNVIHVLSEAGQAFAFEATHERYHALGSGRLGDETFATPAVVGDTMYHRMARSEVGRRQEYLVAIR